MSTIVQIHPATRAHRSREMTSAVGMMVALAAWAMMFGPLLFVYFGLRSQAKSWPPPGIQIPIALPALNTAMILASSVALAIAYQRVRNSRAGAIRWTIMAMVLGAAFVGLQVCLWRGLWISGITPRTGIVGTVVYTLTALHGVHVVAGLFALGYFLRLAKRPNHDRARIMRMCAMFWHFVDAVWVAMFVSIFLF